MFYKVNYSSYLYYVKKARALNNGLFKTQKIKGMKLIKNALGRSYVQK